MTSHEEFDLLGTSVRTDLLIATQYGHLVPLVTAEYHQECGQ